MSVQTLTGLEKVAVLLKSLPDELVGKVVRYLDSRHSAAVIAELEKLKSDQGLDSKLTSVLDEVASILGQTPAKASAGAPPASSAATEKPAAKSEAATKVDVRVEDPPPETPLPDPSVEPLKALAALPADLLALALDSENARTISLLINCLDIEVAGELYKRLSPGKRREVSQRFTEQPTANDVLLKRIAEAVVRKCQALRASATSATTDPAGRDKRIASLLRGLDRTERAEMITVLEKSDAELTGRIKALLYDFEDILRMENPSVQKLLSEVDVKPLAQALRGASPEIENKILTNLSKRAQASLKEEAELSGSVSGAKVKQARQTIVEAIQRLDERGDLAFIEN